jgi:hypothetical protein
MQKPWKKSYKNLDCNQTSNFKLFYGMEILALNKDIRLKFMETAIEDKFAKWRCWEISI